MSAPRIPSRAPRFRFAGYGARTRVTAGSNELWLDVGNELRPAVIDQHQLSAYTGSTASLVVAHPDFVQAAVDPERSAEAAFSITLHANPDFDAVAAAWLAIEVLTTGKLPDGAEALARYADHIDQGFPGMSLEQPFTPYAAYMYIAHRLAQRSWGSLEDRWTATVDEGRRLFDWTMREIQCGSDLDRIDAFACPGLFSMQDRREVVADKERYRKKLADARCRARMLSLELPGQFGGIRAVDALLVRDVQNPDDPERVIFFKDWARSDTEASPSGGGFVALSVFHTESPATPRRCILSVRPDTRRSLRGLGALLEAAEASVRASDASSQRTPDESRPGYVSEDPWYDGRGHAYTIVDSPRKGTLLDADRIETIFLEYGRKLPPDALPIVLPQPGELAPSATFDSSAIAHLALAADAGRGSERSGQAQLPPDVFISYPRTKLEWVRNHVYAPLQELGRRKSSAPATDLTVFFDKDSLKSGTLWPTVLAEAVQSCRLFLAVYCEDYFRSNFCQWELQLAIIRDPIATKRLIVPVALEDVTLPSYCALLQAHTLSKVDPATEVVNLVEAFLGSKPSG